jgi:hypothetical protein
MFRRGKRVWRTVALVGALLFIMGPGQAMAWQGPSLALTGWGGAWEWVASWFDRGDRSAAVPAASRWPAGRGGHEKASGGIDPTGLQAPSFVKSDSSSQIDPNGLH